MKYVYESHTLNGLYERDKNVTPAYCEICGDADRYVGSYETEEEKNKLYKEYYKNINKKEK